MFLSIFLSIITRPFLLLVIGVFLSAIVPIFLPNFFAFKHPKTSQVHFRKGRIYTMVIFIIFVMLNLFLGNKLSNHLINKYGEPGTGVILGVEDTNTSYNRVSVKQFPVLLETAEGEIIETHFRTDDFHVYSDSARYHPNVGQTFNLKYLPTNPNHFIILTDQGDYGDSLNCDGLKQAMDQAEIKMNFNEEDEVYRQEYQKALDAYLEAKCLPLAPQVLLNDLKEDLESDPAMADFIQQIPPDLLPTF